MDGESISKQLGYKEFDIIIPNELTVPQANELIKIIQYGIRCHQNVNQRYGDHLPYAYHLNRAFEYAKKYKHLVPKEHWVTVFGACWTHDTVEDAQQTYNDVKKVCGEPIAEITRAVTSYTRGRTREERMPEFVYQDIVDTFGATFVKCCDRLANVEYSKQTKSSMFKKYKLEHDHFVKKLSINRTYTPMFDEMLQMLTEL